MSYIYVLELNNNKYYIGKTNCFIRRYEEHKNGKGSIWTRRYKPKQMIKVIECKYMLHELETTLIYMKKYGIDNVRGASFCNIIISVEEKKLIKKMIADMYDTCFKCNQTNHFISDCPFKNDNLIEIDLEPQSKKQKTDTDNIRIPNIMTFEEQIYENLMKELNKN
jgi:predicted GIY-YIG superfamily endonuclease